LLINLEEILAKEFKAATATPLRNLFLYNRRLLHNSLSIFSPIMSLQVPTVNPHAMMIAVLPLRKKEEEEDFYLKEKSLFLINCQ